MIVVIGSTDETFYGSTARLPWKQKKVQSRTVWNYWHDPEAGPPGEETMDQIQKWPSMETET